MFKFLIKNEKLIVKIIQNFIYIFLYFNYLNIKRN